eukprot:3101028-Lingulodinium_polyedra.AAC.1
MQEQTHPLCTALANAPEPKRRTHARRSGQRPRAATKHCLVYITLNTRARLPSHGSKNTHAVAAKRTAGGSAMDAMRTT